VLNKFVPRQEHEAIGPTRPRRAVRSFEGPFNLLFSMFMIYKPLMRIDALPHAAATVSTLSQRITFVAVIARGCTLSPNSRPLVRFRDSIRWKVRRPIRIAFGPTETSGKHPFSVRCPIWTRKCDNPSIISAIGGFSPESPLFLQMPQFDSEV